MRLLSNYLLLLFYCFFTQTVWANCPKNLDGWWSGRYVDHGPYDGAVNILLHLQVKQHQLSGTFFRSLNGDTLKGTCQQGKIQFYINHCGNNAPLSNAQFINPQQLSLHLYWQNAMIGGDGPALLEKVNKNEVTH